MLSLWITRLPAVIFIQSLIISVRVIGFQKVTYQRITFIILRQALVGVDIDTAGSVACMVIITHRFIGIKGVGIATSIVGLKIRISPIAIIQANGIRYTRSFCDFEGAAVLILAIFIFCIGLNFAILIFLLGKIENLIIIVWSELIMNLSTIVIFLSVIWSCYIEFNLFTIVAR